MSADPVATVRPSRPRTGAAVYRVQWSPGSDRLLGRCHCGVELDAEDPVLLWQWLLAHPNHEQR